MTNSAKIRKACIVGWPVAHSRSPMIYKYWLQQHNIAGDYVKEGVPPEQIDAFLAALPTSGYAGCNVTAPHKGAAFNAIKVKQPPAIAAGSANLIWIKDGVLHGTNTDTYGFMTHLDQQVPDWHQPGSPAVILGSGGSARTIVYGMLEAGVQEIRLLNRTRSHAEELAKRFDPAGKVIKIVNWDERTAAARGASVVINTTSLGMKGVGRHDIDFTGADKRTVVADLVYIPLETEFLASARKAGLRTVDGLGMLLHQAVPSFEAYYGIRPEVTPELRALLIADIEAS